VVGGSLPRGLEFAGDWLTGVPRELGIFRFRVRAETACAAAEQDYVLQVDARPILRAAPESIVFEYRVGDPAPESQTLLVSSTWPELPYSVTATGPWLRGQPEEGVTPRSGSALTADRVAIRVMPNGLPPGLYEARLVLMAPQSANLASIPVKLRVVAADR
jgi:hypothetical protein